MKLSYNIKSKKKTISLKRNNNIRILLLERNERMPNEIKVAFPGNINLNTIFW
jgi:hypothetical protein